MCYVIFYYDYKYKRYSKICFLNWLWYWKALEYMRFSDRYNVFSNYLCYNYSMWVGDSYVYAFLAV